MYVGLRVDSCQILMKLEFSQQIFEMYSNNKFYENASSWSGVVQCGRTAGRTDGQRDMKPVVTIQNTGERT